MGQSQASRADGAVTGANARDRRPPCIYTDHALIVDHTGIYKADVGLRDGRIAAIGKAGNPGRAARRGHRHRARHRGHRRARGRILTAGAFDSHIHFICPQQVDDALMSGVTTMLGGGGTGPAHGTLATTCTPGPWHIGRMLQAARRTCR